MAVEAKLKEEGWNLTPEWIAECCENGCDENIKSIVQKTLDADLNDVGLKFLPDDVNRGKIQSITGNCVLQVAQIVNIAAPKFKSESSARLLKIQLTDGHVKCFGVEISPIATISLNTPPGTKVKLTAKAVIVQSGFLLLDNSTIEVLGGRVESLIEQWNLKHNVKRLDRSAKGREGGPPPWVPFGQQIVGLSAKDARTASAKTMELKKEIREGDVQFDQQRKATIAEAAKAKESGKKIFSGGGRQILDRDIALLMEMGYSVDDANNALRASNSNVENAIKYLQRGKPELNARKGNQQPPRKSRYGRGSRNDDDDGAVQSQPTKSTLFDFLQSKMPSLDIKTIPAPVALANTTQDSRIQPVIAPSPVASFQRFDDSRFVGSRSSYRDGQPHRESNPKWSKKPERGIENFRTDSRNQMRGPQRTEPWVSDTSNSSLWPKPGQQVDTQTETTVPQTMPTHFQGPRTTPQPVNRPQENFQHKNHTSNGPRRIGLDGDNHHRVPKFDGVPTAVPNASNKRTQMPNTRVPNVNPLLWKTGDLCLAKYWEDGKYYPAVVHEVAANGATCVILFTDYGNYEEVVVQDIIPVQQDKANAYNQGGSQGRSQSRPTLEFRRSNNRVTQGQQNMPIVGNYQPQIRKPPQPMYVPPAQRQ